MSKILVSGAQGTLGQPLVRELRKRGHQVWGAVLRHSNDEMMLRADVADYRQLNDAFDQVKPEICFHLAGEFGRRNGVEFPEQLWRTNCLGTHNVIDLCLKYDCHMVFASSSEAYGALSDGKTPLEEPWLETLAPHFHNEYALTKWTNERQIELGKTHGLKATILRFFNIYGPGEEFSPYRSVVCQFIYRLMKGLPVTCYSKTERSLLYVDDWCQAVSNVCEMGQGGTYNIGSPELVDMAKLYSMVYSLMDSPTADLTMIDTEQGNVQIKLPDIRRARTFLKLKSRPLSLGLELTIAWMKERYGI